MKKIFLFIIILLVSMLSFILYKKILNNKEDKTWNRVNNFIYINKHSIEKNPKAGSVSGLFKVYYTKENELSPINKSTYYSIDKYTVFCEDPTIFFDYTQEFDKNGNIVYEEKGRNIGCSCPCMTYDDIYVKELCK